MFRTTLLLAFLGSFFSGQAQQKAEDFYRWDVVQEIRIYLEEPNWRHILDSLKNDGDDDRLTGDVVVNGIRYEKAGIRYKGNSSFNSVSQEGKIKLPFNIKLDYKGRDQALPGGYTTLKLSNIFRDPSFLREVLSYEIAGQYMPAPRANFARVYVNDEYIGLYNSTESVDKQFLQAYFSNNTGSFFKCDPDWKAGQPPSCPEGTKASLRYLGEDSLCYMGLYEIKSKNGWKDLIDMVRTLDQEEQKLESVLDVDQVLWMMAFNNVLVNLDSYSGKLGHNYYLYQDTFGVFHPVIWDMNLSFGGFRYTGVGEKLSDQDLQHLSLFIHVKEKSTDRPLITKLIADPLYRKIYIAHVRTILNEHFLNGRFQERARELHQFIAPFVREDPNKLYAYELFEQNLSHAIDIEGVRIIGLEELMKERTDYLAAHPLVKKEPPQILEVRHSSEGNQLQIQAKVEGAKKVWLCYRYPLESRFLRMEMLENGGQNDGSPSDGVWTVALKNITGIQYYIIAEGDQAASLSPEHASKEFYQVD